VKDRIQPREFAGIQTVGIEASGKDLPLETIPVHGEDTSHSCLTPLSLALALTPKLYNNFAVIYPRGQYGQIQ
jgi:hypothetical protein